MKTCSPIRVLAILTLLARSEFVAAHGNDPASGLAEGASPSGGIYLDANVRTLHGDQPWPSAMPVLGVSGSDQRGWLFGDSSIGWQANWYKGVASQLSLAYDDDSHRWEWDNVNVSYIQDSRAGSVKAKLGRLSPMFSESGLPAWGVTNLFNQAMTAHDHWHDDGLEVSIANGQWQGFGGLYSGMGYPGGNVSGGVGLQALGFIWLQQGMRVQASYAHIRDFSRSLSSSGDGHDHSHGAAASSGCGVSQDCVAGTADAVWLDAKWGEGRLTLLGSLASRRERGQVQARLGEQSYRGDLNGAAIQADWLFRNSWTLGLRQEWLSIANELVGPNSALIARQYNLDNANSTPWRAGVRLAWQLGRQQQLAADIYRNEVGKQADWLWLLQWRWHLDWHYAN